MKKQLTLIAVFLIATASFGQLDSAAIVDAVQHGGAIAQYLRPQDWIPGINNETTTGLIVTLVGGIISFIHRRQTIRKWRKDGTLNKKS